MNRGSIVLCAFHLSTLTKRGTLLSRSLKLFRSSRRQEKSKFRKARSRYRLRAPAVQADKTSIRGKQRYGLFICPQNFPSTRTVSVHSKPIVKRRSRFSRVRFTRCEKSNAKQKRRACRLPAPLRLSGEIKSDLMFYIHTKWSKITAPIAKLPRWTMCWRGKLKSLLMPRRGWSSLSLLVYQV